MAENEPSFDAPIPGQSLTAELGGRPWQRPPQYNTVEEALDYYIPRLESEEVSEQIIDVLEMGIPVTNIADTMQTAGVLEGKHSLDVGMLILPVLVELIMLIADTAGIKYTSGLEKEKRVRGSLVDLAVSRFEEQKEKSDTEEMNAQEPAMEEMPQAEPIMPEENMQPSGGLMSRSM